MYKRTEQTHDLRCSPGSVLRLCCNLFKANWRAKQIILPLARKLCVSWRMLSLLERGSPSLPWERRDHSEKKPPVIYSASMLKQAHTHTHWWKMVRDNTTEKGCPFLGLKKYPGAKWWGTCKEDPADKWRRPGFLLGTFQLAAILLNGLPAAAGDEKPSFFILEIWDEIV